MKTVKSKTTEWTCITLSFMMFLLPVVGATSEELLQDTLKSILASLITLLATFIFFWNRPKRGSIIYIHKIFFLPVLLLVYALGSMIWSHTYLSGAESIRWFIFSLLFFLGMSIFTLERASQLILGIHLGALGASIWIVLQFIFDIQLFPQAANPASTFVNRNFFAEFVICTIPLSIFVLMQAKTKLTTIIIAISLGLNTTALMMTGTRSALVSLLLLLGIFIFYIFWSRKHINFSKWGIKFTLAVAFFFVATVASIGSINTQNQSLVSEFGNSDAIDRALNRTISVAAPGEYIEGSFSVRSLMWAATVKMIKSNPFTGVGAGAWEVKAPLYQLAGSQLETDYYAHNEFLQLIAEYGLIGWLFLISLLTYLLWATYKTFTNKTPKGLREAPLRFYTLSSLFIFLLISNAGFPWRMATTGALFALCLSILAASDIRLYQGASLLIQSFKSHPYFSQWGMGVTALCATLALYIAQQAIECESTLVRAVKIAQTIAQSGVPNDPRWGRAKNEMLRLMHKGIAINPHYRKITPMAADLMASWGDWKNATWIWESIGESRPYVVAILTNIARGYLYTEDYSKAREYIERAKKLQPTATSIASLDVVFFAKTGQTQEALSRARYLINAEVIDRDLIRSAYFLGVNNHDPALAIAALKLGIKAWPTQSADALLKLGRIYETFEPIDEYKAEEAYRAAVNTSSPEERNAVLSAIPKRHQQKFQ